MPVKDRVMRHRAGLKQNALARVEVVVPIEYRDDIRAFAANLLKKRSNARLQDVRDKISMAYARFGAACLDNISVDPATATLGQADVIANALIQRGNKDAFCLGRELKQALQG
jgi:hypothetical protein